MTEESIPAAMVFLVDDDPAIRESWVLALNPSDLRLELRTFESAEAFLAAYQPGETGCLLADVRMPTMSGLDLQTRLKAQG
jgi:FixJ family two-component response regulator